MFEKLFGNKKWHQSLTAWGLVIFFGATAAIDQACSAGVLTDELCGTLSGWSEQIGAVLTVLGLRKAATARDVA